MRYQGWRWIPAALATAALLGVACGGDDGDAGDGDADATDVEEAADADLTGRSVYEMTITLLDEGDQVLTLDRDLTGREDQYFAFGSTHIAPAVSLAMGDDVTVPRTIQVILDFGIVVASSERPIDTDGPGTFAFGPGMPAVEVTITGLEYSSQVDGASGSITVDAWSVTPGETVSGSFSGTLVQDTPSDNKRRIALEGSYHFTLPAQQGGQPQ